MLRPYSGGHRRFRFPGQFLPQTPCGLGGSAQLLLGEIARHARESAVTGDFQLLRRTILQANTQALDEVLWRLGVVSLNVDEPGGEDAVTVPVADQLDLCHLARAELNAES